MQLNHVPANSLSLSYFYVQICRRLKFAVIITNIDLNDYTKAREMRNRVETNIIYSGFCLTYNIYKKGQVWEGLQKLNLCHLIETNHTPLHPNPGFKFL